MRTSFSLSSLARTSLFALTLAASASHASITVERGSITTIDGISYTVNPANNSTWYFSEHAEGALAVMRASLSATGPASVEKGQLNGLDYIKATLPVSTVTGTTLTLGPNTAFGANNYSHDGGLTISLGKGPGSRVGGSLTISAMHVDLSSLKVYADLSGSHGVDSTFLPLFDIVSHTNAGAFVSPPSASVGALATLSDIRLTSEGKAAFSQALALSTLGNAALNSVESFGTITSAVPEPSTWGLLVAGMLTVGAMKRRRATTH